MSEPGGRKRTAIDLLQEVVHLREVNRDLVAALKFYADRGNWEIEVDRDDVPNCEAYDDEGKQARAAIAKAKGEQP